VIPENQIRFCHGILGIALPGVRKWKMTRGASASHDKKQKIYAPHIEVSKKCEVKY